MKEMPWMVTLGGGVRGGAGEGGLGSESQLPEGQVKAKRRESARLCGGEHLAY